MPKNSVLPFERFTKKKIIKCKPEKKCKTKTWLEKKTDARIRLFNNEQ